MNKKIDTNFVEGIMLIVRKAQSNVLHQVNSIMFNTYFKLGKRIVEQEQNGIRQADYGSYLLEILSIKLTNEFGKAFSKRYLELIRKYYITCQKTKSIISQSLSCTHYSQRNNFNVEK